uniref:PARP alpha-helical domain-containing protein n=1 Tax=Parastrongyloides trichosuri TaxID=131310 RepID=A0A0N4ZTT8_PARTI
MAKKGEKKNAKAQGPSKKVDTSKVSKRGPVVKPAAKGVATGSNQATSGQEEKHKTLFLLPDSFVYGPNVLSENLIKSEVPAKMSSGNPDKQGRAVWKVSGQLFVQMGRDASGSNILERFKPTRLSKVRFDSIKFIDGLTKAAATVVHTVSDVGDRLKAVAKALESGTATREEMEKLAQFVRSKANDMKQISCPLRKEGLPKRLEMLSVEIEKGDPAFITAELAEQADKLSIMEQ